MSARAAAPLLNAARAKQIDPALLVEGTGCTLAQLTSSSFRMSWASFARFLVNVGHWLNDEELFSAGATAFDTPVLRALFLPGRVLFSLPEIVRWASSDDGPASQVFAMQHVSVEEEGSTLRIRIAMADGYDSPREHWIITHGALLGVARAFGVQVDVQLEELHATAASYSIRSVATPGVLARIRSRAAWVFQARDVAERLREVNKELYSRNLELAREVDARKLAEAELRRLNEELEHRVLMRTNDLAAAIRELEAANEELSMFSTSAAHDLRSPLRAINGFATALREDHSADLDDDARRLIDYVIQGAVRLGALIDAMLSLSSLKRGELHRVMVDVTAIVTAIVVELRAREPERDVEIVVATNMTAYADPALAHSLFQNLLDNAWKFTRHQRHARVEVALEVGARDATFFVRDNGVGFDMKFSEKLFQPFQRLHKQTEFAGNGVGLATVERIVRRHGGRVRARSQLGEGTEISVTLPMSPDEHA